MYYIKSEYCTEPITNFIYILFLEMDKKFSKLYFADILINSILTKILYGIIFQWLSYSSLWLIYEILIMIA